MADLKLDTDFLRQLGTDLRDLATEFEHANARSDYAGETVGHGDLAERVREFAHNWDDRRKKIQAGVQTLGDSAAEVGKAFDAVEDELVAALRGEG